jgi:hypothetical protein
MRFAVHGPGSPVASPRSHGVPRRDVHGRVHISIAGETAGRAREPRLALARVRIHVPARRAPLAREVRLDPLDPSAGLVLQAAHQQAPARPQDLPVQPGLSAYVPARADGGAPDRARHVPDLQILDPDQVEPSRYVRTGFLGPVLSPVGLAGAQPGDGVLHVCAAVRPAPGASELALQAPQPVPLLSGQARHAQQLAGRQSRGHCHAPVDPHRLAITRPGDRLGDRGEGDMPAASAITGHPVRPHALRHLAGPAEPHPPGFGDPNLTGFPAESAHVPLAPAPHDPEPLIPVGLAPRRPPGRVARVEEGHHRPGEVTQGLLLHRLRARGQPRVLRPHGCELPALLQVARRSRPGRVPVRVLFHGQVPHVPGVAAVVPQDGLLGGRGEQPVTGHANILSTGTDILGEVKRRFLPGKAGVSTPRS